MKEIQAFEVDGKLYRTKDGAMRAHAESLASSLYSRLDGGDCNDMKIAELAEIRAIAERLVEALRAIEEHIVHVRRYRKVKK